MALPLPSGLTPAEIGFLCETELVTVIPRQRLDALELMGGNTKELIPPFPTPLPLWLALLLKRQQRANIQPPPWLDPAALTQVLDLETREETSRVFAPPPELPSATTMTDEDEEYLSYRTLEMSVPFLENSSTSRAQPDALPYHWLEMSHLLLANASDDFEDPEAVRRLVRDLKEVRISKLRRRFRTLGPGAGVEMNGIGGMEIAEVRGFVSGVIDGLRRIGKSREEARGEREQEERENGRHGTGGYQDDDDDMQL